MNEPNAPGSRTVAELAEVIQGETQNARAATIARRSLSAKLALARVQEAVRESVQRGLQVELDAELTRRGFAQAGRVGA